MPLSFVACRIVFVLSFVLGLSVEGARADIVVGGARPATVRVPATYDPAVPSPLLILLHGYGGDGTYIEPYMLFRPLTEKMGILFTDPKGTEESAGVRFWNATDACCNFIGSTVDDSGYLKGLIDEIKGKLNVDADRIYLVGHSNGGFMAYRMACDHPETIAAICSLAGSTFQDEARSAVESPVHVLQVHGTSDASILYGGGSTGSAPYPGAVATVERWAARDGCTLEPQRDPVRLDLDAGVSGPDTNVDRYADGCAAGGSAELWTIVGGGPGPGWTMDGASTSFAVHVLDWLMRHPKIPGPQPSFSRTPAEGLAPLDVVLDASASIPREGTTLTKYSWDFGDGASGEGMLAGHTYTDPGRYIVQLRVTADDGRRSSPMEGAVEAHVLPSAGIAPWTLAEIGEPAFPGGGAWVDPGQPGGDVDLWSGGSGIDGQRDGFLFAFQEVKGDFSLTMEVSDMTGGESASKIGVMFRDGLRVGSPYAATFLAYRSVGGGTFRLQWRTSENLTASFGGGRVVPSPKGWVRIERRGEKFKGFSSTDGTTWSVVVGERLIPRSPETLLVGIAAAGYDRGPASPYKPLRTRLSHIELSPIASEPRFVRGDANGDRLVDITDGISILDFLFLGGRVPPCFDAADANDSGGDALDISDAVSLFGFLFLGSLPALPAPGHEACGPDPTADLLGCAAYPCG